jgi:D-arabinose 1-dehydrogenase-like Zn-dependent alcohol dehydrogenase
VKVRCLQTLGQGYFTEVEYTVPEISADEIRVEAVITGVCRSDIDMMMGDFPALPLHMQGHEGVGRVTAVGDNLINSVNVGDIVATRGEPAYADVYNCKNREFVVVPHAEPKYILEPVACAVNIVYQPMEEIVKRSGAGKRLLIIGSGFLSWVAYQVLLIKSLNFDIDVIGQHNTELWGDKLLFSVHDSYDVVIDLSGKYELGTKIRLNNNALIIDAVGKAVSGKEAQCQLWQACTTVRPSPRNDGFYQCMVDARDYITNGKIVVDNFWTKCYNRNVEWQQAFVDGAKRPRNYSRGYIKWP